MRVRVNRFDLVATYSLAALYSMSRLEHMRRDLFHFFGFLRMSTFPAFPANERNLCLGLSVGGWGRVSKV